VHRSTHYQQAYPTRRSSDLLENIQRELVHATTLFQNLVTCPDNGFSLLLWQGVQTTVGHGRGLFHHHHATDELRDGVDGDIRDLEVIQRTHGVHAVISIFWNLKFAQKVFFHAGLDIRGFYSLLCRDCWTF